MPKIKVNGRELEVAAGKTVIQACFDAGIFVPHYCWHPGLTPAGNCRMCLVKVAMPPPAPPQPASSSSSPSRADAHPQACVTARVYSGRKCLLKAALAR